MPNKPRAKRRRALLVRGCAIGFWSTALIGFAQAQSGGLDMDASPRPPVAAPSQPGELDMDVNPHATIGGPVVANPVAGGPSAGSPVIAPPVANSPVANSPAASSAATNSSAASSPVAGGPVVPNPAVANPGAPGPVVANPSGRSNPGDNAQNGSVPPGPTTAPEQTATPARQPPATEKPSATAAGPITVPEPIALDHPTVIDTANLKAGGIAVTLFGIEGMQGQAAQGLQGYLASSDDHLTCQAQTGADFVCLLPDGTDVAQVALVNGAARAKADAPEAYREQEIAAQTDRRGIWASLPPPPVIVAHPVVQDTATLTSGGQTYVLDGLIGFGQPYAAQLQGYIVAHGDSLTCQPQNASGYYLCTLGDGTDIAKVALVNGAARVAADAPDAYRVQQGEALANRRGYWLNPPADVLVAIENAPPPIVCCTYVVGDDGADGITYVGGVPTALIDGKSVFFIYGGDAGWGYYDQWHHWRDAPYQYRAHLDHYHPYGNGLRGYHNEAAMHPGGVRPGAVHPGAMAGASGHPGSMAGAAGHPGGMVGASGHSGGVAGAAGHPGGMTGAPGHPNMASGYHPGMAGGGNPGYGNTAFVHPGPSAGGFHPSAGVSSAPARSGGGGGGGGGRHR